MYFRNPQFAFPCRAVVRGEGGFFPPFFNSSFSKSEIRIPQFLKLPFAFFPLSDRNAAAGEAGLSIRIPQFFLLPNFLPPLGTRSFACHAVI
jgi:hypothetical protein